MGNWAASITACSTSAEHSLTKQSAGRAGRPVLQQMSQSASTSGTSLPQLQTASKLALQTLQPVLLVPTGVQSCKPSEKACAPIRSSWASVRQGSWMKRWRTCQLMCGVTCSLRGWLLLLCAGARGSWVLQVSTALPLLQARGAEVQGHVEQVGSSLGRLGHSLLVGTSELFDQVRDAIQTELVATAAGKRQASTASASR